MSFKGTKTHNKPTDASKVKYPIPHTIHVSSSRLKCAMNGDFDGIKSSATAYAWFVWHKGFIGDPVIKWFN